MATAGPRRRTPHPGMGLPAGRPVRPAAWTAGAALPGAIRGDMRSGGL
ncbi:hypothetical protein SAMN05421774_105303 [Gemmobacter megaterium]|uniref:Uncharacterized protein n=1 Tax=Gemmobacter megaterium TaxID=1086013 RepID=A0A1N7PJI6_9RHOB|nr:hypothetical protein SAMN05421774_105303 [Gemmobacter megaterium]